MKLRTLIILGLIMLSTAKVAAQLNGIVYIDVSDQGSRKLIREIVDSVVTAIPGEKLIYLSNGSNPFIYETEYLPNLQALMTIDPSLPNPYYDLDSLVKRIHHSGFISETCQIHFFLGAKQAFKGEKHIENLAEKLTLVLGLSPKITSAKDQYTIHLNEEGRQSLSETNPSQLYNISWYQ